MERIRSDRKFSKESTKTDKGSDKCLSNPIQRLDKESNKQPDRRLDKQSNKRLDKQSDRRLDKQPDKKLDKSKRSNSRNKSNKRYKSNQDTEIIKYHESDRNSGSSERDYRIISLEHKIDLEYYSSFCTAETTSRIFNKLMKSIVWNCRHIPSKTLENLENLGDSGNLENKVNYVYTRRCNQIYGHKDATYEVKSNSSSVMKKRIYSWNNNNYILKLKNLAEVLTNEKYDYCIARKYPNGKIGLRQVSTSDNSLLGKIIDYENNSDFHACDKIDAFDDGLNDEGDLTNDSLNVTHNGYYNVTCTILFGATRILKLTPQKNLNAITQKRIECIKLPLLPGSFCIIK